MSNTKDDITLLDNLLNLRIRDILPVEAVTLIERYVADGYLYNALDNASLLSYQLLIGNRDSDTLPKELVEVQDRVLELEKEEVPF